MAKRTGKMFHNELVTVKWYTDSIVGRADDAISIAEANGSTLEAIERASIHLPDACAFEEDVCESCQRGLISKRTETRLWNLAGAEYVKFAAWAVSVTGLSAAELVEQQVLYTCGFWGPEVKVA